MGNADDPSSLTPTELYALQNDGAAPGGPSAYDRFRSLYGQASDTAGDAVSKLKEWRDNNPAVGWATGPAAPALLGPAGTVLQTAQMGPAPQHISASGEAPTRDPVSFERTPPAGYDGGAPVPTASPQQLPNAPMKAPAMAPGMGPGGDVYEGYGTDKGVLHSQLNTYDDMAGLQDKKGEEYTAHLASLKTAADMEQEVAAQQRAGAQAYKATVDQEDQRQQGQEQKIQQATDSAAAAGVDPGRFFKNRDTGFWINMMIGSIAGGYLSAAPGMGGKNTFMDSIRDMQDKDIKSQETAIDQGWKKVKGTETAYERMRQNGVDKTTATLKQADLTLAAIQTDIKGRLMSSQIPEEKARLEGALQTLQIERDKYATTIQETWRATRESRGRAAATAAMAQHAAERQARLDADEHVLKMSQAEKNSAEAGKLKAEAGTGGLTKEDAARMLSLQSGYSATEDAIRAAQGNTKGSITGAIPGINAIPGTDAMKFRQGVDEWNTRATLLLGPIVETMNKGKPGAVEMHDLQKRVLVDNSMPLQERVAHMKYMQKLQEDAAATLGRSLNKPPAFVEGAPTFTPKGK